MRIKPLEGKGKPFLHQRQIENDRQVHKDNTCLSHAKIMHHDTSGQIDIDTFE